MKLKLWQRRLFYLILFLIPANLAKHFILPSSYISGILVDYLVPTLYLTDILILILLISTLFYKGSTLVNLKFRTLNIPPILLFLILLLPSVVFASSPFPTIYKYLKLIELSLFALWIKRNISFPKHFKSLINVLSASVLFQSVLAIIQWLKQSSIGGYWLLGQQPYTASTPGIDKITWFTGAIKVPPMGTFPHPNVLAGFLAVVLPLIIYKLLRSGKGLGSELPVKVPNLKKSSPCWTARQFHLYVSIFLGLITLFLTFSLSAWLGFLMIGLPFTLKSLFKVRNLKFFLIYSGLFLILFSFATKFQFLAPASSFSRRSELTKIALKMFRDHPILGVGLNNFTVKMEQYGHVTATTRFLQPVHNIYLLILTETGLVGLLGLGYLFFNKGLSFTMKDSPYWKVRQFHLYAPIFTLLFIGLFDHYPFTIQQGLLLLFISAMTNPTPNSRHPLL